MKGIIYFLMMILCLAVAFASAPCTSQMQPSQMPCQVITPCISCTNYTYSIINENTGQPLENNTALSNVSGCVYGFIFNYNQTATYRLLLCNNQSATIAVAPLSVQEKATLDSVGVCPSSSVKVALYYIMFGVILLFIILAFVFHTMGLQIMAFLSSIGLIFLSLSLMTCLGNVMGVILVLAAMLLIVFPFRIWSAKKSF